MVVAKNRLDELLIETVLSNGMQRQGKLQQVREYIQRTPTETLIRQIGELTSIEELRFLQAAGIPAPASEVFLAQFERLGRV